MDLDAVDFFKYFSYLWNEIFGAWHLERVWKHLKNCHQTKFFSSFCDIVPFALLVACKLVQLLFSMFVTNVWNIDIFIIYFVRPILITRRHYRLHTLRTTHQIYASRQFTTTSSSTKWKIVLFYVTLLLIHINNYSHLPFRLDSNQKLLSGLEYVFCKQLKQKRKKMKKKNFH